MLADLGFPYKFINWNMECVSSVSYSLVLNRSLTKTFQGKRGIRLDDPMTPLLVCDCYGVSPKGIECSGR